MNVLSYLVGGVAVAMALSGCVPAHRDVCEDWTVDEVHRATCEDRRGDGARLGPASNPAPSAPGAPDKAEPDDKPDHNGGKSNGGSSDSNGDNSDE